MSQVRGVIEPHAARPLHDRLEHDRGNLGVMFLEDAPDTRLVVRVKRLSRTGSGPVGKPVIGQDAAKAFVHAGYGIADAHGAESVAVVAAPNGREPPLPGVPLRVPVLKRHLECHFHRDRTGIAEEHVLQAGRSQLDQQPRQLDRRFVGEAAKHDVRGVVELLPHDGVESGMVVAVDGAPP